jgi:poly-beta-hydroxybutyrate-responsive repressor
LLQLAQKPAHGYELLELFGQIDDETTPDPGSMYRTLRVFEEEGLVRSNWDTSGSGPARRIYSLTDQGIEYLHAWAVKLQKVRQNLDRFLVEYETHFSDESKGEHVSSL